MNQKQDLTLAFSITLTTYIIYLTLGLTSLINQTYPEYNTLHFFIFPSTTIAILAAAKLRPLYASGISFAYFISYALYIFIDIFWARDMIGLDHWLAAPGALAGATVALLLLKKQKTPTQTRSFLFGLTGTLTGFLLTNAVFCNTLTYCGPISILLL